ncbi:hypothetical protein K437DRAFT_170306 [Tilletiaria anomala UBC 951]|uniref:Uncharacterized protein n=1 Tax=Tilletiaria anomala (strain ATCC 24038 / CBS 436.72 / UBC 951) TaxID=1037660 RepID=A0A066VT78_TILAU|nr:uncharacterized protein K437DRAFT_170306 [Tilletiaria anomala UBC 951]KDN41780.1 hypothetical protein K437DRAFT_170306 [Tilletiaria anomala UBC 951]
MAEIDDLLFSVQFDDDDNESNGVADVGTSSSASVTAESAREGRIRRALEEAKRTYTAQIDSDAWYREERVQKCLDEVESIKDAAENEALTRAVRHALETDKRSAAKLEWTLSHLYATARYLQALSLALACLKAYQIDVSPLARSQLQSKPGSLLHFPSASGLRERLISRGRGKSANKHANCLLSQMASREVLDTAIRSICKLFGGDSDDANREALSNLGRRLVVLVVKESLLNLTTSSEERFKPLIDGMAFQREAQNIHWTAHSGSIVSAADLCLAMGHLSDAIEAYSIALASRGSQARLYKCVVFALSRLKGGDVRAQRCLAKACAAAALISCTTSKHRLALATELEAYFDGALQSDDANTEVDSGEPDIHEDAALIMRCHAGGCLTLLSLVALVHGALSKRAGGAADLAVKFDDFFARAKADVESASAGDEPDEDTKESRTFRSVRTL